MRELANGALHGCATSFGTIQASSKRRAAWRQRPAAATNKDATRAGFSALSTAVMTAHAIGSPPIILGEIHVTPMNDTLSRREMISVPASTQVFQVCAASNASNSHMLYTCEMSACMCVCTVWPVNPSSELS